MLKTLNKDRKTQLTELLKVLAEEIDAKPGARDMAGLCKQFRETLKEIDELTVGGPDDEVKKILENRTLDGKPGAVRKSRAKVSK